MDERLSGWLARELPALQAKHQVLAFSCGADSVASLIRMRQWDMTPALVYYYFLPDLPMVENYLRYVEDKLGQPVYRFPGALCLDFLANGLLQHPGVGKPMHRALAREGIRAPKTADINDYVMQCFPGAMLAIGLRVSDGIFRAQKLRRDGPVAKSGTEWYPVCDCYRSDIVRIIRDAGWKLPVDYLLFGRSFESLRHWTARPIRERCPKTWARLLEVFPQARLLCAQDAMIPRSRDIDSRISAYADLAFDTETCS